MLIVACLVPTAHAQEFVIASTEPQQGSTSVALQDTVYFDFTTDVTVSTDWDGLFSSEPQSHITRRGAALCIQARGTCAGGDETVPRFVRLPVIHQESTDYTWFVEAVQTPDGEVMAEPFTLHYTTAATIGQFNVGGTISTIGTPGKRTATLSPTTAGILRAAAQELEARGMGRLAFSSTSSRDSVQNAAHSEPLTVGATYLSAGADTPGHTRVLLLSDAFGTAQSWLALNGTTIRDMVGDFSIPYVRPQEYWPLAVLYTDGTANVIEQLGFFDPNGDGSPEPIEVTNSDMSGVDLGMYTFVPATALAMLDAATTAAAEIAADQQLKTITSDQSVFVDGTTYTWTYGYYSPSLERVTEVRVDPLGVEIATRLDHDDIRTYPTIDSPSIVDSDIALLSVMNGGGSDFIMSFPVRRQQNAVSSRVGENLELQWQVVLRGVTSSGVRSYARNVSMSTGEVVSREESDQELTVEPRLTVFPNPFRERVTIEYSVHGGGHSTLRVYDVVGREVGQFETNAGAVGQQTLQWDGRTQEGLMLPSGPYFLRLETPTGERTAVITLVR